MWNQVLDVCEQRNRVEEDIYDSVGKLTRNYNYEARENLMG